MNGLRECRQLAVVVGAVLMATAAVGQNWTNSGGNDGRYSYTDQLGPDSPDLLWSGARSSIIAWLPVIEDRRVFTVRQTGFPPSGEPNGSPVVAIDLDSGNELWSADIPYNTGDWTTWVGGVKNGKVYAARSGNGASVSARLYCLDAATGNTLWVSDDETTAGAYDGMVFAPNGDPVIASFQKIWRISEADGSTVWTSTRVGSVSGNCGGAVFGDALYVVDAVFGGHEVVKYDLATGTELYQSVTMPGTTIQNTPMIGPDGTIYVSRTQNNDTVDFFYALEDTGSAIVEKWNVPAGWSTSSEFTVGPDGSIYMLGRQGEIQQLDPTDGTVLNSSAPVPSDASGARFATDAGGRVFFSNASFGNGRIFSFDADLTPRWDVSVQNVNIGAPAFGPDGTLVVCGVGSNVRAYRTPRADCAGDLTGDSVTDFDDFSELVNCWNEPCGDLTGDGTTDFDDFSVVVNDWNCGL